MIDPRTKGCLLDLILIYAPPVWLCFERRTPFWLMLTALVWLLVVRSPTLREQDRLRIEEVHGEAKSRYLVWLAPLRGALLTSLLIYGLALVGRWLIA